MAFLHDDFLLTNETARRLYHDYAAAMPIYDYHCHLPPADLSGNRRFTNLHEAWLDGDHYKWRAMRAHGVDEQLITGDAEPYDKFLAFAKTIPSTLRNPLFHWTHLELRRYFGIDVLLNEETARDVWEEANRKLADLPVAAIFTKMKVALVGTIDDPADDLAHHQQLASQSPYPQTTVIPAFRPDRYHVMQDTEAWNDTVDQVGAAAGVKIRKFDDFLEALAKRHVFFHDNGCRLSDHGMSHLPEMDCSEKTARDIFDRARGASDDWLDPDDLIEDTGHVSALDEQRFRSFLMTFFGRLDHAAGWTQQLHLGVIRNNNSYAMEHLGPDTGFDSICDTPQFAGLRRHLGTLAGEQKLPQTILYNLNPKDNYLFATMAGNFQGVFPGVKPGHVQLGSGWWFLDQKEGMQWQLNALSNLGLLPHFIGMLTDSRSFLSYPRHEYFRRILCNLIGQDAEAGELPNDLDMLGSVVQNICFNNARDYFGMDLKI